MIKKIFHKIFFPHKIIGFILFNISFGLLIYVFSFHLEDNPIAYVSYLLSTYALIIFCIWFYKACQFSRNLIKKQKIYQVYQANSLKITKATLYISTIINILYCLFNLVVGIYYHSFWFITFAIYYFLLSIMKVPLLSNTKNIGTYKQEENKKLKRCGIILLILNIVLIGIILLIIRDNQNISYAGYIIYAVALYDFYLIITAFINLFKYRKSNSPILLASKCINLTVAMISMLSLEVAMVTEFGNNDINFKRIMTGSMGFFICFINTSMAIYMIVKANKHRINA